MLRAFLIVGATVGLTVTVAALSLGWFSEHTGIGFFVHASPAEWVVLLAVVVAMIGAVTYLLGRYFTKPS